jgi:hypothetical protein
MARRGRCLTRQAPSRPAAGGRAERTWIKEQGWGSGTSRRFNSMAA